MQIDNVRVNTHNFVMTLLSVYIPNFALSFEIRLYDEERHGINLSYQGLYYTDLCSLHSKSRAHTRTHQSYSIIVIHTVFSVSL